MHRSRAQPSKEVPLCFLPASTPLDIADASKTFATASPALPGSCWGKRKFHCDVKHHVLVAAHWSTTSAAGKFEGCSLRAGCGEFRHNDGGYTIPSLLLAARRGMWAVCLPFCGWWFLGKSDEFRCLHEAMVGDLLRHGCIREAIVADVSVCTPVDLCG